VQSATISPSSVRQAAAEGRLCYSVAAQRAQTAHLRQRDTLVATPGYARATIVPRWLQFALLPPRLRRAGSLRCPPGCAAPAPLFGQKRPTAAAAAAASSWPTLQRKRAPGFARVPRQAGLRPLAKSCGRGYLLCEFG